MCGIAGIVGITNIHFANMLESLSHRGKDDRAVYEGTHATIGMNRLSVIDMTKGLYPMKYKDFVLVYNGEIYNHKSIRDKLRRFGINLRTNSDAEIILPLYDRLGIKAFDLLDGMFALCIYDTKSHKIVLARDRLGEKPLYYFLLGTTLIFASELKSILQYLPKTPTVRKKSVLEYLKYGSVNGGYTLINNVYKLLPAHALTFQCETGKTRTSTYWKIPDFDGNDPSVINNLEPAIKRAVSSRMLADVPVGTFLSGGLDSSLMTLYAAQTQRKIHTFSVTFPDDPESDESSYARFAAKHIGTSHHEVRCDKAFIRQSIQTIGKWIDEPVSDQAFLPTLALAREAAAYVKVVLSGEGADELFAGYYRYRQTEQAGYAHKLFALVPLLGSIRKYNQSTPERNHYAARHIWHDNELKCLFPKIKSVRTPNVSPGPISLPKMQQQDIQRYLPDQLFMKVDKATMAYTVEARAPYVALDLIKAASTIPVKDRVHHGISKYPIKKIAEQYFPRWFVHRPKQWFTAPLGEWFRTILKNEVEQMIAEIPKRIYGIRTEYVRSMVRSHINGTYDYTDKIWNIMVLYKWLTHHNLTITNM